LDRHPLPPSPHSNANPISFFFSQVHTASISRADMINFEEFMGIEFKKLTPDFTDDVLGYLCLQKISSKIFDVSSSPRNCSRGRKETEDFGVHDKKIIALVEAKSKYTKSEVDSLTSTFKAFAHNPDALVETQIYITEESFSKNMRKFLGGFDCNVLTKKLYIFFSKKIKKYSVFLHQFLNDLHPLIKGDSKSQNEFVFHLYDSDRDNHLSAVELSELGDELPKGSEILEEFSKLVDYYVYSNVIVRNSVSFAGNMDIKTFHKVVPHSCCIKELRDRFLGVNFVGVSVFEGSETTLINPKRLLFRAYKNIKSGIERKITTKIDYDDF